MAMITTEGDVVPSLDKTLFFLEKDMNNLIDELAVDVMKTSQAEYSTINGKYVGWFDGNPSNVVFNKENIKNGKSVVASGTSLLFLEFGTGMHRSQHPLQNEFADQGIVPHGQYGKGKGKGKHWAYPSRRKPNTISIANGIDARAFMYKGFKRLDGNVIAQKIKEKIV